VRPGKPVKIMLLKASGRGRRQMTSRKFAMMSWSDLVAYRHAFYAALAEVAARTAELKDKPDTIGSPCTDDGGGRTEYSSGYGVT